MSVWSRGARSVDGSPARTPDPRAGHGDRRGFGRQRAGAIGCLGIAVVLIGIAAFGAGKRSPECSAYDALRDAVRAVDGVRSATAAGDLVAVERQMDEVDRLLGVGRTRLADVKADSSTGSAARAMLEAANYLEFMVGDYRSSGEVDFSITQFASRELTRAVSGAGGAPLNC
jgi:hypothetical protein